MAQKLLRVVLAKVSVNENLFAYAEESIREGLARAFLGTRALPDEWGDQHYLWVFEKCAHVDANGRQMIFGMLNRIHNTGEVRVWNSEERTKESKPIDNLVDKYFWFLYEARSEILAIQEQPGFSPRVTAKKLALLLERNSQLGAIQINILPRAEDLLKAIKRMERIIRARFEIIPSNPESRPSFEELDRAFKKMRATHGMVVVKGKELKFEGTLLEEATNSVLHGNGKFVFEGEGLNGKKEEISSDNYIYRRRIRVDDNPPAILEGLKETVEGKLKLSDGADEGTREGEHAGDEQNR